MSTHFVMAPFGSAGDVHPFLGLALALQRRGHRVTFVVNGYFEALARQLGLDIELLGTRDEFLRLTESADLWHPLKSFGYIYRHGIQLAMRDHFEILRRHASEGPIVSVTSALGFGGRIAQEKLGIPLITVHLQPAVIWSDMAPPEYPGAMGPLWFRRWAYGLGDRWVLARAAAPTLNAWRRELQLPPLKRLTNWWHSSWSVLCLFPEWYAPAQPDWPPNVIQTGFPLWDERADEPLPTEVAAFLSEGDRPIAFTPGSANQHGQAFFEAASQACKRLGRRGMLLTRFPHQVPRQLPEGVRHFDYVPFASLLPHIAALVHHGGVGTTAQALAAGVPQLIVPLAHDQFDNGVRVERLGVGKAIDSKRLGSQRLATQLAELLDSPSARKACDEARRRVQQGPTLDDTAQSIEEITQRLEVSARHA